MGDKKEWLKSEIEDLINMYHNKPELWDLKNKVYRDRVKKRDALAQIAAKFKTTIEEISRKIHNLRNQFNSESKKVTKKKSGQGTDELYNSKWPYFKSLSFLENGLVCRSAVGNIVTDDAVEKSGNENETETDNQDLSLDQYNEGNAVENSKTTNQGTPIIPRKKQKCIESKQNDLLMQKAERALNEEEDQYDIYGRYVASEMRNLSVEYLRKKMKRKFQQVILEIYEEEEQLSADNSSNNYTNHNSDAEYLQTETESSYFNIFKLT